MSIIDDLNIIDQIVQINEMTIKKDMNRIQIDLIEEIRDELLREIEFLHQYSKGPLQYAENNLDQLLLLIKGRILQVINKKIDKVIKND